MLTYKKINAQGYFMFKTWNYSNCVRKQIEGMELFDVKEVDLYEESIAKFRSTLRYVTRKRKMIFQTKTKDDRVYVRRVR